MARHENKYKFDPGRLNHKIEIFQDQTVINSSGDASKSSVLLLTTKAGRIRVNSQLAMAAGLTGLDNATYYVIRKRSGFTPNVDMTVRIDGGDVYVIKGIDYMDDPVTYIRLLCQRYQTA